MIILRDDNRIAKMRKAGQYVSFLGMALLIGGLIIAFTSEDFERVFYYQLAALMLGYLSSQVGIHLTQRYGRNPRPDELLDDAIRKVARGGRFYHYLLPAPHVLLIPSGIIVFITKHQTGNISVEGNKWKQKGVGLRRFFGQESLGNPTREAEIMISNIAGYLKKHAPSIQDKEIKVGAMIVFTTKGLNTLDVRNSTIPAMHYTKVKGFLRQQRKEAAAMPEEDFEAIRAAFDLKAAHLIAADETDLD